ncbi:MAG: T9SS type A sorting domain-containing protein [candidate division Zixibacteria bacterium]|nr:T9SS type A sorting domain-containing protein [candidate division Zixibacteria bacterium]
MYFPKRKLVFTWLLCIALSGSAAATDVTLRLVDQHGGLIEATWFYIDATVVLQEGVVTLSEGTYTLTVYAGLDGNQRSKLRRNESVDIAGAAQTIELVWPTATFTIDILNQDQVPISGSTGRLYDITNANPMPFSVVLPVTEDPDHPNISGDFATGYRVYLYPGVNGVASNQLNRHEWDNELPIGDVSYDFVWPTAEFKFDIVDQNHTSIPGSTGRLYKVTDSEPLPASAVLPVTEDPDYPNISGDFATGYRVYLYPGVNGVASNQLYRHEGSNELPVGDVSYDFLWRTAEFELDIVDQNQTSIPGSTGRLYNVTNSEPLPSSIVLPVTEDPDFPNIGGDFATGYRVYLYPGVNGIASNQLYRHEGNNELPVGDVSYDFLWPTATFEYDIVDQYGVHIPGSVGRLYNVTVSDPLPASVVLPVTEDPDHPNINGDFATGYRVYLYPGLNGSHSSALYRHEWDNELPVGDVSYDFVWPTATVEFDLLDQDGDAIPGSQGYVYIITNASLLPHTAVLPVTEDPGLPNINGDWSDGYRFKLFPGINGNVSNDLLRNEWDNELTIDGLNIDFEWMTLNCCVGLVDATEEFIPGSFIGDFGGTYHDCDMVTFPSTAEALYPTMTGDYMNGYPISLYPGGTLAGTATFEVTDVLDFAPTFVTLGGSDYGLRSVPSVVGQVMADCPAPGSGLLGVTVDVFSVSTGDLVATAVTDQEGYYQVDGLKAGEYALSIVVPLGYNAAAAEIVITFENCLTVHADFNLSCIEIIANPRAGGFWKHQVGVALGGNGNAQIDGATLCEYLDIIEQRFNSNEINQVIIYDPPPSGECLDKLLVVRSLLNLKGKQDMVVRARQQLMALLLNVAADYISLTEIVSNDDATLSQAITYCDNLIDDPNGDHVRAKTICEAINTNQPVGIGLIDLSTFNVAYKQAPHTFSLLQNYPNPFNPTTTIAFSVEERTNYKLKIYNVTGQVVCLFTGVAEAGDNNIVWDASSKGSGAYFYRLETAAFTDSKKMILLK